MLDLKSLSRKAVAVRIRLRVPSKSDNQAIDTTARLMLMATDFLPTFLDYPPRQSPGCFSVGGILQKLEPARSRTGGCVEGS